MMSFQKEKKKKSNKTVSFYAKGKNSKEVAGVARN
jgi:hypothetical protein